MTTGNESNRRSIGKRFHALLSAGSEKRRAATPDAASPDAAEERVMETVSRLAGGVAHDLNNILLVVQGYTEMALGEEDAGPSVRALLAEVKEATARAARLLRDLLILGQRGPFTPRVLDMDESVRRAVPTLQEECGQDIRVICDSGPGPAQILADEEMLGKLLIALAARGREAMPRGGTLTLAVRHEGESPRRVVLRVTDTGDALSAEERGRLFEPYLPGRTGGKGRGLGLSLVYAIARRFSGSVSVESRPGAGTELRVSFPAREASSLSPSTAEPVHARSAPIDSSPAAGVSILIAEDDDGLRALATKILAREGYNVLAARDGQEAAEIFERERERVRLVILDDVMPRMGGRAALARIRQSATNVPAILCSGYTWSLDGQNQEIEGFSIILPKPWQPRELLRSVREGLEMPR